MELPDNDRAVIAFQLLSTLKPPSLQDANDPMLLSEIECRIASYDFGKSEASSIEEVNARIQSAMDSKKSS